MNTFQREVLRQIKQGIDRARHEGVQVEYPRGALIDGEWVPWPFDALDRPIIRIADQPSAVPAGPQNDAQKRER